MGLIELKEWLKIDSNDEDATLSSLLLSSKIIIKQSTGVKVEDVQENQEALELYKLVQKFIVTDLYENRAGSNKISPIVISLFAQLEAFKLGTGDIV